MEQEHDIHLSSKSAALDKTSTRLDAPNPEKHPQGDEMNFAGGVVSLKMCLTRRLIFSPMVSSRDFGALWSLLKLQLSFSNFIWGKIMKKSQVVGVCTPQTNQTIHLHRSFMGFSDEFPSWNQANPTGPGGTPDPWPASGESPRQMQVLQVTWEPVSHVT